MPTVPVSALAGLTAAEAAEHGIRAFPIPHAITVVEGYVAQALRQSSLSIAGHDAYVAGPAAVYGADAIRAYDEYAGASPG